MQRKWYDNKTLLAILIIFVFPIGVIGIWLRNTETPKKVIYTILGFFAWCFTFPVVLIILLAIFIPSKTNQYHIQDGDAAMKRGDYALAVDFYQNVDSDYEKYDVAQQKLSDARQKLQEQKAQLAAYKKYAINEVKESTGQITSGKMPYTVMLLDAKVENQNSDTTFSHQYKVILEDASNTPYDTTTNWVQVSDTTFDYYINDVGMALLSANDSAKNEYSAPPGYNNYVGNTRYGTWKQDSSGNSFWEFYGKYAFLRTMLGFSRPIYRYDYYDYRDYYRGSSSYYGTRTSSGNYRYGTQSRHAASLKPQSAFKRSVNSRISRSGSTPRVSSMTTFRSNVNNTVSRSARRSSSSTISRSSSRSSSFRSGSSSRGGK